MGLITEAGLKTFEGVTMQNICPNAYYDVNVNHCAHFVGHALKLNDALKIGYTCAHTGNGKSNKLASACLRVNELYNRLEDLPVPAGLGCLVYVTLLTNVDKKSGLMHENKHKHVGIYFNGDVWNYSTGHDGAALKQGEGKHAGHVRREKLADFTQRIDRVYHGHTVVKYTVIPNEAEFLTLAEVQALAKPK